MTLLGRGARIVAGCLLVAWCFASWMLSSQSDPESFVGVHVLLNDKIEHGIEYGVAGFLAACAASSLRPLPMVVAAIVFCGAWGTTDEIHQSYVPGRECSRTDLLADLAGGALGAVAFAAISGRAQTARRAVDVSP